MKKLFMLFSLMFMPMIALADMGAPAVISYTIEVTNPDGVPYYEMECENNSCKFKKKGIVNYGTTSTIYSEEKINNEIYIFCSDGWVRLSDVTVISVDNFNLEDVGILKIPSEESINLEVVVDNANINSCPASACDVIGTLKKGSVVNPLYYYGESPWYYIEENGVKGWVNTLDGDIVFKYDIKAIITKDSDILNQNGEKIGFIKEGTTLNGYYDTELWTLKRFIKYNDVSGFISYDSLAEEYNNNLYIINDIKMFKSFSEAKEYDYSHYSTTIDKSVFEIEKGEVIKAKYSYQFPISIGNSTYFIIEYNGKNYWIVDLIGKSDLCVYRGEVLTATNDIKVYKDDYDIKDQIGIIKKGTTYNAICNNYVTTSYFLNGFISSEDVDSGEKNNNINNKNDTIKDLIKDDNGINTDIEDNTNDEKKDDEDEIIIENKSLSKNEIIYISIGLATAFVLSSIVTIILINKKKKIINDKK